MFPRKPKGNILNFVKFSAKTLFVVEAVCFAVTYGVYYRMNTNREFRQYINENFPFMLNYYYKVGEFLGNSNLREIDATVWNTQEKKK